MQHNKYKYIHLTIFSISCHDQSSQYHMICQCGKHWKHRPDCHFLIWVFIVCQFTCLKFPSQSSMVKVIAIIFSEKFKSITYLAIFQYHMSVWKTLKPQIRLPLSLVSKQSSRVKWLQLDLCTVTSCYC